jgi:hypothetical protein
MPAAYLTTPAGATVPCMHSLIEYKPDIHTRRMIDVVKTRLQVEARKGQTTYKGLADAFTKICK